MQVANLFGRFLNYSIIGYFGKKLRHFLLFLACLSSEVYTELIMLTMQIRLKMSLLWKVSKLLACCDNDSS